MSGMFRRDIRDNPEAQAEARKWVKALRSGEFEQCQGYLKEMRASGPAYCCLGVACEVAGVEWKRHADDPSYFFLEDGYAPPNGSVLPSSVMDGLYLHDCEGGYMNESGTQLTLVGDNDSRGRSFLYIADRVEKELEEATA